MYLLLQMLSVLIIRNFGNFKIGIFAFMISFYKTKASGNEGIILAIALAIAIVINSICKCRKA